MPIVDPHWPRADAWLARANDNPQVLVVGVPSSQASLTTSRADLTPGAVRDRFSRFSTFHGETGVDFEQIRVRDVGDWPVSELDMHQMPAEVAKLSLELPQAPLTLFLGGDNAITRPLVAARREDLGRVGVITFDAHHDVRSLENGPTNGTPIRGLIEEHGLPGSNVVQIGIHSFANSAVYRAYCDTAGIEVITVADVEAFGMTAAVDRSLQQLKGCDEIYVDVDVDVLDRVFAPGCPGARPGGLTMRQLSEGVRRVSADSRVSAMDFVEVDAALDSDGLTLDAVAHLMLTAVAGFASR